MLELDIEWLKISNLTYRDAGILERTHLRFFTLNEIDKKLKNTGYTNIDYSVVFSEITEENASFIEKITELSNNANIEQKFSVFQ